MPRVKGNVVLKDDANVKGQSVFETSTAKRIKKRIYEKQKASFLNVFINIMPYVDSLLYKIIFKAKEMSKVTNKEKLQNSQLTLMFEVYFNLEYLYEEKYKKKLNAKKNPNKDEFINKLDGIFSKLKLIIEKPKMDPKKVNFSAAVYEVQNIFSRLEYM